MPTYGTGRGVRFNLFTGWTVEHSRTGGIRATGAFPSSLRLPTDKFRECVYDQVSSTTVATASSVLQPGETRFTRALLSSEAESMKPRIRLLILVVFACTTALAWTAWSNREIPLTEAQLAWSARTRRGLVAPLPESNEEWRVVLSRRQYRVLRKHGTERAFDNEYWNENAHGLYRCAGCGQPLFWSTTKYKSGTGWPSFTQPVDEEQIAITEDRGWFFHRKAVECSRCGGHLGHVFPDGPAPTNLRYCMNSAALHLDTTRRPSQSALGDESPDSAETKSQ